MDMYNPYLFGAQPPVTYPAMSLPVKQVDPVYLTMQFRPLVEYGLLEAQVTGYPHAMMEVALIAFLIGSGYDPQTAYLLVESWEIDEVFPGQ